MREREQRLLVYTHENNKRRGDFYVAFWNIMFRRAGRVPTTCELYFCVGSLHFGWSIHPSSARVRRGRSADKRVRNDRKCFRTILARAPRQMDAPFRRFRNIFAMSIRDTYLYRYDDMPRGNRIFHSQSPHETATCRSVSQQGEQKRSQTSVIL